MRESPEEKAGENPIYVVGIGASAGGLEALEEFFANVPPGTGAAFAVVQHLSPDFKSLMDQLLARHSSLRILRAEDGMPVEPDCIYLNPPRKDMTIQSGRLALAEQSRERAFPQPIDAFFRSLAKEMKERAIAVVLSGTGSDGSRGAEAVKEVGGVVLVQDRLSAKFDGMPSAAVATGSADIVLPPDRLAQKIVQYMNTPDTSIQELLDTRSRGPFHEILEALANQTRIDFREYKPHTVQRRVLRRMGILGIQNLNEFRDLILDSSDELLHLAADLLIGVTEFFRDPDAFRVLERHLIDLLNESKSDTIRVWVAGCSTGQEAYTMAILLAEMQERLERDFEYKIFATDVNEAAINTASEGRYPFGLLEHLSQEVLQRHFDQTIEGYVVRRRIRDRVVFAVHNLMQDPPFTRMDLVTCRNLLIYFKSEQQQRVLHCLHFALVHKGLLFLGPSEGPGDLEREFKLLESKWKVFQKVRDTRLRLEPTGFRREELPRVRRLRRSVASPVDFESVSSALAADIPTTLVLDSDGQVLHTFGDPSPYLGVPKGRASLNVMRLMSSASRSALSTAMHQASSTCETVRFESVRFGTEDDPVAADLVVRPLGGTPNELEGYVICIGPTREVPSSGSDASLTDHAAKRIEILEQELRHTKEDLQATIEELETANEEFQGTNEELLSSNEELQSTNEELHSVNEELYTVNAEHHKKIEELMVMTEDMENLLQSTEIGTIFLDSELRIRKYTAKAAEVVSLLPSDVGRPIEHLSNALQGVAIGDIARSVLQNRAEFESETVDQQGVPRLLRFLPYYTQREISGLVITIVDISRVKAAQASLAVSEARFQELVESLDQVFWTLSSDGSSMEYVSAKAEEIWGVGAESLAADSGSWMRHALPDDAERVRAEFMEGLQVGHFDIEYRVRRDDGEVHWLKLKGIPVAGSMPDRSHIVGFVLDITESKKLQEELLRMTREFERKAQTDALTDLCNRHGLEVALSRELGRASRSGMTTAAILVDVDDFKSVNDSLGHATGDVVLQGIATRMEKVLRPCDILSRVGGGRVPRDPPGDAPGGSPEDRREVAARDHGPPDLGLRQARAHHGEPRRWTGGERRGLDRGDPGRDAHGFFDRQVEGEEQGGRPAHCACGIRGDSRIGERARAQPARRECPNRCPDDQGCHRGEGYRLRDAVARSGRTLRKSQRLLQAQPRAEHSHARRPALSQGVRRKLRGNA